MRGVYYSACRLCYKTIAQFHQKCLLMRDCLLFRRLLLPESTVIEKRYNKKNYRKVSNFVPRLDNRNKSPFHSLIYSGYMLFFAIYTIPTWFLRNMLINEGALFSKRQRKQ